MKLFSSLFLSLCLMTGSVNAATTFAPTQCLMLGSIAGEMTMREIRGESYQTYLFEMFPEIKQFPEDLQKLVLTLVHVIKKDRATFPDTADVPQAHEDAVVEFCFSAGGQVSVMQKGFEDFIK